MANGKKTDQNRIDAQARRQQALDLRKAGASYRAIGAQLAISEAQAHRDVKAALARLAELELESAGELRALELARLDTALLSLAPKMQYGDPQVVNAWVRVSESRRKLLGLDAAPKTPLNPDGTPGQYAELRAVVLTLLSPYPEIRVLLAEQLSLLPEVAYPEPVEGTIDAALDED